MDFKAIGLYLEKLKNGKEENPAIDDADLADYLEIVKQKDEDKFFSYLNTLPTDIRAQTFIELPTAFQIDLIIKYDINGLKELIESLESDDATDLYIAIDKTDKQKAQELFLILEDSTQKMIEKLMSYDSNEAGSLMQTEIFKVTSSKTVQDSIEKLRRLKKEGIGTIQNIFVTDSKGKLLKDISIDDLILEERTKTFEEILDKYPNTYSVVTHESIDEVVSLIEKYDLVNLAVVDRIGHLIGRITHDDVVDIMQQRATKQIYNMSKLDEDEQIYESFTKTTQTRAKWLTINLINVTLASIVIGLFEDTINAVVALAVLMPIVANMAGTSSAQTMTVTVRQLALGEINSTNIKQIILKEFKMAMFNGILFGGLIALISQIRYHDSLISLSISLAIFLSFLSASIIGTSVPMLLKKINIDPAIASSVFVLTFVDIIGFFSFLMLAKYIVL